MLYAYTNTSQTVLTNDAVEFETIGTRVDRTATIKADSASVSLNMPGVYEVSFNADVSSTDDVTLHLYKNGTAIDGAESTVTCTASTDVFSVSFTALVRVLSPFCYNSYGSFPAILTIVNEGEGATLSNAAITVKRVG